MSLRKRTEQKSAETSKATKRIGLVAKLIVDGGVAPYGRGITNDIKGKCYVGYTDESEEVTRQRCAEATEAAIKHLPITNFSMGPVLRVKVVPDTSMTPTSRWTGGMYSLAPFNAKDRFTHKRHADFIFDHMSPEIDELEGQPFWGHVAWQRLDEDHGGDLSLIGNDANDELAIIITFIKNKREATALVKALRDGETDTDALCTARGYDVTGIRQTISDNAQKGKDKATEAATPTLTALGPLSEASYMNLSTFTEARTIEFLKENLEQAGGDIDAAAEKCKANPGDIAVVLNKPEYFKGLMDATGLGETEAVVKVAEETGLANAADLAKLLNIDEAPF